MSDQNNRRYWAALGVLILGGSVVGCECRQATEEEAKSTSPKNEIISSGWYDTGDGDTPKGAQKVAPPAEAAPEPDNATIETGPADSVPGPRTTYRITASGDNPPYQGFGLINSAGLIWASEGGVASSGARQKITSSEVVAGDTIKYDLNDSFSMKLTVADDRSFTGTIKGRTTGTATNAAKSFVNPIDWSVDVKLTGRFVAPKGKSRCDNLSASGMGTRIQRQKPYGSWETTRAPVSWKITGSAVSGAVVSSCKPS
jgi:hypothetical protein